MEALKRAISKHDLEALSKLLDNQPPRLRADFLLCVIEKGFADVYEIKYASNVVDIEEAIRERESKTKELVKLILDRGVDVNERCSHFSYMAFSGRSAFGHACYLANAEIVKMMIDLGGDLFFLDSYQGTPIEAAFNSNSHDKIKLLLDHGVSADDIDRLKLLHIAVGLHDMSVAIVQRIVQLGADVDGLNEKGNSVLFCAVEGWANDYLSIVKFLLDHGADVDAGERSALSKAARLGRREMVQLLLDHGANVNGSQNERDDTPINAAARLGHREIVQLLLDYGANVNGSENARESPIHAAARNDHLKVCELLLNRGARQDESAVTAAICHQLPDMVELFLNRGFDPNCVVGNKTLLSWAVKAGNEEIVKVLLDCGASVNDAISEGGQTAVHLAVERSLKKILCLLLCYGADVNVEYFGQTALARAIQLSDHKLSKVLVRHMIFIQSRGFHVSEANLNSAKGDLSLRGYLNYCTHEMDLLLKLEKFEGYDLSYVDIYKIRDVGQLAALARDESILQFVQASDFKWKYPIYGEVIVDNLDKGIERNKRLDLIKRFFNYLSARDHDKLSRLPETLVDVLFTYLGKRGVASLKCI